MHDVLLYLQLNGVEATPVSQFGTKLDKVPYLVRGVNSRLRLRFFDNNSAPVGMNQLNFPSFIFAMDNDWNLETTPPVKIESGITVNEVVEEDGTFAEIVIPLSAGDLNTEELIALLTGESLTLGVELTGFAAGNADPSFLAQWNQSIRNRRTSAGTGTPEPVGDGNLTAAQIYALLATAPTIQYSADGSSWTSEPGDNDLYFRFALDGSNFGGALLIPTGAKGDRGEGLQFDAKGTLAQRDDYDEEISGFIFFDMINAEYYIKNTPDVGDWSDAVPLKGADGEDGKSAFQSWLDEGNSGTEADFIASLKGEKGEDAAEVIIEFSSDNETWHAPPAVENDKFMRLYKEGETPEPGVRIQGLQGLQGIPGSPGPKGDKGDGLHIDAMTPYTNLSLYADEPEGFTVLTTDTVCLYIKLSGDTDDWSDPAGIKGDDGSKWTVGDDFPATANAGDFHLMLPDFDVFYRYSGGWLNKGTLKPENGAPGAPGAAAPQVMMEFSVNAEDWHAYEDGVYWVRFSTDGGAAFSEAFRFKGDDGKSAYELWLDDGNSGTEQEFLASLKAGGRHPFTSADLSGSVLSINGGNSNFLAIIDNDGNQWPAEKFAVTYTTTGAEIDLANILAYKNITSISGTWYAVLAGAGVDGKGLDFDAHGSLADRDAYDDEAAGFRFLVVEESAIYIKNSGDLADWSDAVGIRGIDGTDGTDGIDGDVIRDFEILTQSGSYTPTWEDGNFQRVELAGNMTILPPTTIPNSGMALLVEAIVPPIYILTSGGSNYSDGIFLVSFYRSGTDLRTYISEV